MNINAKRQPCNFRILPFEIPNSTTKFQKSKQNDPSSNNSAKQRPLVGATRSLLKAVSKFYYRLVFATKKNYDKLKVESRLKSK